MGYKIATIDNFRKEAKRLIKKFPSLVMEIKQLGEQLSDDPFYGTPIGNDCYKIRLAIASKGKGKSGGARVITHIYVAEETVYLLSIYDKSDQSTLTENEILQLLKEIK